MEEVLVIDGYNIIYAWPNLIKLKDEDLEHARLKLIETMINYRSIKGLDRIIIVFDAHMVKGGSGSIEKKPGLEIIFTQEGQKADTVIESLVGKLAKKYIVYVATSDWAEQRAVLGSGAVRLSARELLQEIEKNSNKRMIDNIGKKRYGEKQLGWRLKKDVLENLEEIRRGKQ